MTAEGGRINFMFLSPASYPAAGSATGMKIFYFTVRLFITLPVADPGFPRGGAQLLRRRSQPIILEK